MKVSVVIPVYNPGPDIDRCIESLIGQSLPSQDFEAIFVDDGSTDETPARLDALAAERPNLRVIHIPNSGWPGKPRNIGIANATGEYVQFLDQDDHLAPEALDRLYRYGKANDADIVIGKVASNFRGVALGVFARSRPSCTIHDAPLIDSLTPHKMFRRSFLAEHGLAYPEGKRRLEDQLLMVQAYFRASSVAILADYPCYFYYQRSDKSNAGSTRIVPAEYYRNLREVLDVVLANTEPGEQRAKLVRRFCRVEILSRLSEPSFQRHEPDYRRELFEAARAVLVDVTDAQVEAGLGSIQRLRAHLVRDDRSDALLELALRVSGLRAECRILSCAWVGSRLVTGFEASISHMDGRPLELIRRGETVVLDPTFTDGLVDEAIDVTDELAQVKATTWVRDEATAVEWRAPAKAEVVLRDGAARSDGVMPVRAWIVGSVALDPQQQALGGPLADGRWGAWLRVGAFGLDLRTRLGGEWSPAARRERRPAVVGDPPRIASVTLVAGTQSGAGAVVTSDGTGTPGPTRTATTGGHGLRLDLTTIATPQPRLPVGVETADDDATPGVRLGTIRRDLAGHLYFEGSGDSRRTRQLQAIRRYGVAAWRRAPIPARARAAIRAVVRALRRR